MRTDTRPCEADTVVIECDERPQERRGACGGFECAKDVLAGGLAQCQEKVERCVSRESPDEGADEAR